MKKFLVLLAMIVIAGALIFGGCAAPAPTPAPTTPTPAPAPTTPTPAPTTPTPAPTPAVPTPAVKPPPTPAPKIYELSLNLFIPPIHTRWTDFLKPWTEGIMKASNGRIVIKPYFLGAISAPAEVYDSAATGLADMGESPGSMKPGRLPILDNILNLVTPSIRMKNSTQVVWEVYKATPEFQKQMSETKVLFLHCASPLALSTKKETAWADIPKLKMASSSGGLAADRVLAMCPGGSVVPTGDVYSALEKGVIDGCASDYELMKARLWGDYLKFYNTGAVSQTAFFCVMNKKKYASLPADLQKVIDDASGQYAVDIFGKARLKMDLDNMTWWEKERGGKTIYTSAEDLAKMDATLAKVVDKFIASEKAKGNAYWQEVYDQIKKFEKEQSVSWDIRTIQW